MNLKYFYILFAILLFSCDFNDSPCVKKGWSEVKIVEGEISLYSPMDEDGHGSREWYFVDSVFFSYSDYNSYGQFSFGNSFYNNSCVKGGVICENGQKVRIHYKTLCDDLKGIVKIELLD
mgnify:CR=1 FL=1